MKLSKCPFCNSKFVGEVYTPYKEGEIHQVTCHACNAEGPSRDTERKAVNAWNKLGKKMADLEEKKQRLFELVEAVKADRYEREREAFIARTKERKALKERGANEERDTKAWTSFDRTNKCNHTFDNPRCPYC